jgi:hypothetical protein
MQVNYEVTFQTKTLYLQCELEMYNMSNLFCQRCKPNYASSHLINVIQWYVLTYIGIISS